MPILSHRAQRPRTATRVVISGGPLAVQALIAVTLFSCSRAAPKARRGGRRGEGGRGARAAARRSSPVC